MGFSRFGTKGTRAAALLYAGYKWFEDHTDDVERWSDKAIAGAHGKRVAKVVVPAANATKAAARWVRENGATRSGERQKRARH
jgi:hypothetical protein